MWIVCEQGYFSVVHKPGDDALTVRARLTADLDRLRATHMPGLGPTNVEAGTDYPARATCSQEHFAEAMSRIADEIDYSSLRHRIRQTDGDARATFYDQAATVLSGLEELPQRRWQSTGGTDFPAIDPTSDVTFGGVLVDREAGRLLLREPTGHYGGYVWTIAKGRALPGEAPEQTALRAVHEETGFRAQILEPIPQWFEGDYSWVGLYVMEPVGEQERFESFTQSVRWVDPMQAFELVSQNRTPRGRRRDRRIVRAVEQWLSGDDSLRMSV